MKEEIEEKYSKLFLALDPEDPTCEARKYSLENRKEQVLDAVNLMNKHGKRLERKDPAAILKIKLRMS